MIYDPRYGTITSEPFDIPTVYNVTYNGNGHGSNVGGKERVAKGDYAKGYTPDNHGGWSFVEWCEDKECTKPFDFSRAIDQNITLYAKWRKITASIGNIMIVGNIGEDVGTDYFIDLYVNGAKFRTISTSAMHSGFSLGRWPDGMYLADVINVDDSHVRIQVRGAASQQWHLPVQNLGNGVVPASWTDAGANVPIEYNGNARFFIGTETELVSELKLIGFPEKLYAGQTASMSFFAEGTNVPEGSPYDITSLVWMDPYTNLNPTGFEPGKPYILIAKVKLKDEDHAFSNSVTVTVNGNQEGVDSYVVQDTESTKMVRVYKEYIASDETPSYTVTYRDAGNDEPLANAMTGIACGQKITLPEKFSDEAIAQYGAWKDVDAFSGWLIDGVKYAPGDEYTVWSNTVATALYEGTVKRTITMVGLDRTTTVNTSEKYLDLPSDWPEELGEMPANKKLAGWYSDFDGQTQLVRVIENGKIKNYARRLDLTGVMEAKIYPVWMPISEGQNAAKILYMKFPEDGEQAVLGEIEFASPDMTESTTMEDYALAYIAEGRYNGADPYLYAPNVLATSEAILAEQTGWYYNGEKFCGTFVKGEQYQLVLYLTSRGGAFESADARFLNINDKQEWFYGNGTFVEGSNDQIIRVEATFTAKTNQKDLVTIERADLSVGYEGVGADCSDQPEISVDQDEQIEITYEMGNRWFEDGGDDIWMLGYSGANEFEAGKFFWCQITMNAKDGYKFPKVESIEDLAKILSVRMGPFSVPAEVKGTEQDKFFAIGEYLTRNERKIDVALYYKPGEDPAVVNDKVTLSGLEFPVPGMKAGESLKAAGLTSTAFNLVSEGTNWIDVRSGNELTENDRFAFGGAYCLKVRLQPKEGSNAAIPEQGIEILGSNADGNLITTSICNIQTIAFNDDGTMDVYAGMNPENIGELSLSPVKAFLPVGNITTYGLQPLTTYVPSYEDEAGIYYNLPTGIRFDCGVRAMAHVVASIDGGKSWKQLSKGFDGLYPDTEYVVSLLDGEGVVFDEIVISTGSVPAVCLAEGKYPIPNGAFMEENARYATLTDISVNYEFAGNGTTEVIYKVTGEGLSGLSNIRMYVTWRKDNGNGMWTTFGKPAMKDADGRFRCEVTGAERGMKIYAFVMGEGSNAVTKVSKVTEAESSLFKLAGASMNLGNSLDMLFLINKADVTETDCYATIRKVNAGKDDTVKTYQFSEWYTYGPYYLLQYDKLTAMEMNDKFYVQVFHADGTPASEC
ncbi:MAG: InlB B-repeat-containing protein [Lachnospiraceae bacterium]|nr:InlB B-repeat-containing protein [Lachnospiraceae bacterium]